MIGWKLDQSERPRRTSSLSRGFVASRSRISYIHGVANVALIGAFGVFKLSALCTYGGDRGGLSRRFAHKWARREGRRVASVLGGGRWDKRHFRDYVDRRDRWRRNQWDISHRQCHWLIAWVGVSFCGVPESIIYYMLILYWILNIRRFENSLYLL